MDVGALWAALRGQESLLEAVWRHSPPDAMKHIHALEALAEGLLSGPACLSVSLSDFHDLHQARVQGRTGKRGSGSSSGAGTARGHAEDGPPCSGSGSGSGEEGPRSGSPEFWTPSCRPSAAHAKGHKGTPLGEASTHNTSIPMEHAHGPKQVLPEADRQEQEQEQGRAQGAVGIPAGREVVHLGRRENALLLMASSGSKGSRKHLEQQVGPYRGHGRGSLYGGLTLQDTYTALAEAHPKMLLEEIAVSRPGTLSKELRDGLRDARLHFDGSVRLGGVRKAGLLLTFPPAEEGGGVGYSLPSLSHARASSVPAWSRFPGDPQPQEAVGAVAAIALAQPLTQMALEAGHDGGSQLGPSGKESSSSIIRQLEVHPLPPLGSSKYTPDLGPGAHKAVCLVGLTRLGHVGDGLGWR